MNISLKDLLLSVDPVGTLRGMRTDGTLVNFLPSVAALDMPIPAGYHHKDNLEHSFQVLQNAIDREVDGADLILRTAALFHDIGKPATRKFEGKGVVTFTNHDVVGAKIVRSVLASHGYSRDELREVSTLVFMHMRSHTFKSGWSESAVRRLAVDAGSDVQLQRLIVIFYSDATTKIDKKKAAIHSSVDDLSAEFVRVQAKDVRAALRPALDGNEVAELLGLKPGRELGQVMKFLNTDDMVGLSRDETIEIVKAIFSKS